MHEFVDYLTRKYCVAFEHRGPRVILQLQDRDVGVIHVRRNASVVLQPEANIGEPHRRFVELLRFKMASRTDKAIKAPTTHNDRSSQCTKYACFDSLTRAFRKDWAVFNDNQCVDTLPGKSVDAFAPRDEADSQFSHQLAQLGALFLTQQNWDKVRHMLERDDVQPFVRKMIGMLHKHNSDTWQPGTKEWEQMEIAVSGCHNKDCFLQVMRDFSERLKHLTSSPPFPPSSPPPFPPSPPPAVAATSPTVASPPSPPPPPPSPRQLEQNSQLNGPTS